MRYALFTLLLVTQLSCANTLASTRLLQLDYDSFTIWLDCARHGAVKFSYTVGRDSGNLKRNKQYHLDPNVPASCQQRSFRGYGHGYDRGHLVPANHLDHSKTAIRQSNFMTNILPQASAMNQGAWLRTEEITECYRDIEYLQVIGGVIWGNNPSDDYFLQSHSIQTPDAYWKVIIRGSGQSQKAIAWIVPNSKEAKKGRLDDYLVSVAEIERVTGEEIPVADDTKQDKPKHSWRIPRGCDKG